MREIIDRLVDRTSSFYPHLKRNIRIAHLKTTPDEFILKNFKLSVPLSLGLTMLFFFVAGKLGIPLILLPLFFIAAFVLVFNFTFLKLKGTIIRRQKEIDREVLFAGQYLLIKL